LFLTQQKLSFFTQFPVRFIFRLYFSILIKVQNSTDINNINTSILF